MRLPIYMTGLRPHLLTYSLILPIAWSFLPSQEGTLRYILIVKMKRSVLLGLALALVARSRAATLCEGGSCEAISDCTTTMIVAPRMAMDPTSTSYVQTYTSYEAHDCHGCANIAISTQNQGHGPVSWLMGETEAEIADNVAVQAWHVLATATAPATTIVMPSCSQSI